MNQLAHVEKQLEMLLETVKDLRQQSTKSDDVLLNKSESSKYLNVCISTFDNIRREGSIVTVMVRNKVMCRKSELDRYIANL